MATNKCDDRIRFSLSDESGVLCFESFAILDAPECRDMERKLQTYLVGRPLSEVNTGYLQRLACNGDGSCTRAVIRAVEENQGLFLGEPASGDGRARQK